MKKKYLSIFASTLAFLQFLAPVPTVAQSLSVEDIKAKMESKVERLNEYQVLLNDPDPIRSMAVMEIMLESGDAKLVRMALDYGLYSPNPRVRYTALKAQFDSLPLLRMEIDGSKVKDSDYFARRIGSIQGTVGSDSIGFVPLKVGEYDPKRSCYRHENSNDCFIRLTETEVSLSLWNGNWFKVVLDDRGKLVGEVYFDPPAPVVISFSN